MKATTKLVPVDLVFSDAEWTSFKAAARFCERTPARLAKDIIHADLLLAQLAEARRLGVF